MISPQLLEYKSKVDYIILKYEEFVKKNTPNSEAARSVALYRNVKDLNHFTKMQEESIASAIDPTKIFDKDTLLALSDAQKKEIQDFADQNNLSQFVNQDVLDGTKNTKDKSNIEDFISNPGIEPPPELIEQEIQNNEGLLDTDDDTNDKNRKSGSDDLEDWLKSCIPCWGRIKDLGDMKFKQFLKDQLKAALKRLNALRETLKKIKELFNNTFLFDQICLLFDFFTNFVCLPDLVAMFSALNFLISQLVKTISIGLGSDALGLVIGLLSPIFLSFSGILNSLIGMILAPIDCVISAIRLQAQKIPDFNQAISLEKDSLIIQYVDSVRQLSFSATELDKSNQSIRPSDLGRTSSEAAIAHKERINVSKEYIATIFGTHDFKTSIPSGSLVSLDKNKKIESLKESGANLNALEERAKNDVSVILSLNKDPDTFRRNRELADRLEKVGNDNDLMDSMIDSVNGFVGLLETFGALLHTSRVAIVQTVSRLETFLQDLFNETLESFQSNFESALALQKAARIIGFIKFLIKFKLDYRKLWEECKNKEESGDTAGAQDDKNILLDKFMESLSGADENKKDILTSLLDPKDGDKPGQGSLGGASDDSDEKKGIVRKDRASDFLFFGEGDPAITQENKDLLQESLESMKTLDELVTTAQVDDNLKGASRPGISIVNLQSKAGIEISFVIIDKKNVACKSKVSGDEFKLIHQMMADLQGAI